MTTNSHEAHESTNGWMPIAESACSGHEWYPGEGNAFYCCKCGAYREADDATSGFAAQELAERLQAEVETLKAELAAMRAQLEALKVALGESNDEEQHDNDNHHPGPSEVD